MKDLLLTICLFFLTGFLFAQTGNWSSQSYSWAYYFNSGTRNINNVTPSPLPQGADVTTAHFKTNGTSIQSASITAVPGWLPVPSSGTAYTRLGGTTGGQYELIGTGTTTALKITQATGSPSKFSVYGIPEGTSVAMLSFHMKIGDFPDASPQNGFMRLGIGKNSTDIYTSGSHIPSTENAGIFGVLVWTYTTTNKLNFSYRKKLAAGNATYELIDATTFEKGGEYDIEIYCNNALSGQTYTRGGSAYNLPSRLYHVWVNGNLMQLNGKTGFPEAAGSKPEIPAGEDLNSFVFNHGLVTAVNSAAMTINNIQASFAKSSELPDLVNVPIYIDSENGNDANDGLAESTAWKSLSKINSTTFATGAKILLKAGGIWTGQLHPKGSGSAAQAIIIDSYGTGSKPLINGNGLIAQGAVLLSNQSNWEINNLEITNNADTDAERRGVEINASNYGTVEHIHLKNLEIHDVKGTVGSEMSDKKSSGIYFTVINDNVIPTRFNDILVEGCHIYNCQNQGIVTSNEVTVSDYPGTANWEKRKYTNLIVRNNVIHHISKNAMIIRLADGGLVERNLCYETATGTTGNTIFSRSARNTVFQYNEGYLNRSSDIDGSLYDPDLNSPGTIWQYSYSHDNAHGLIWICTSEPDTGVVVRYNISQNDKGYLMRVNFPFTSVYIYNNVFYIGSHVSPTVIREDSPSSPHTYYYYNNIIYNQSVSSTYSFITSSSTVRTFNNNIFYGHHPTGEPADPFKITSDPLFVDPGTATIGLNTVGGYKLRPGSPALNTGKLISNNGGRDYFGLPVSSTTNPNRGFYNGEGTTIANPDDNFHLYLLIGQSNMAGRGAVTLEYASISHPRVKMLNKDNEWVTAKHPLHFDKPSVVGVGPGLEFAIKMAEANPDITIGLIPSAVGGTGIDLWQPVGYDSVTDTHPYDDALIRAKRAMLSGVMKGILWHQGEGNSGSSYATWPAKVKELVNRLRLEFGNEKLPFIIGELGYYRSTSANINNLLPQLILEVPYTAIASAQDLLSFDGTHFDSPSATTLGERYVQQILNVQQSIANTLPVKLIHFKALKKADGIELNWTTVSEINNDFFEPERSADGKTFVPLGTVKGAGNTSVSTRYSFYDNKPLSGINYYRLKQTDYNGTASYSFPTSVNYNLTADMKNSLVVYPNPASAEFEILMSKPPINTAVTILIYDLQGKKQGERLIKTGELLKYNVGYLNAGIYQVEVRDSSGNILGATKLIKK